MRPLAEAKSITVPHTSCEWYRDLLPVRHSMAECNKEKVIWHLIQPIRATV